VPVVLGPNAPLSHTITPGPYLLARRREQKDQAPRRRSLHDGQVAAGLARGEDRFAGFVAAVAARLDDHEASTAELAAGLYLSRSHLDRVVRAAAGESAAGFRRRILLERAAYRLREADATVLDVAVEAGFTSNEAFTRSFRRSYGVTPSQWRQSPGRPRLPCPNDIHFHPPGALRLLATTKETSMDVLLDMVRHHRAVIATLIDRAELLDDARLDAPITLSVAGIDRDPTIRSLLSRLVGQMDMWMASVASRPYDFEQERHESLESMRSRLADAGEAFQAELEQVAAEQRWADTFVDATGERSEEFTYAGMVAHVITYAAHRRTIVTGALESAGQSVDDDPLVWFAPS
jgi:AraC-like DNA-binding protein